MVFSKFETLETSCMDYVHPWEASCVLASISLLKPCIKESLRIYLTGYTIALMFRGRTPTLRDLKRTVLGIIRSCIFLTFHGVGYSATVCLMRKFYGKFNFFTISFIPSFLSSIVAILIERPSRRGLLSLYVTNVASETVFKMAVSRNKITPIPYGEVAIFSFSIAYLLYFYKIRGLPRDPLYSLIRWLVGSNEEYNGEENYDEIPTKLDKLKIDSSNVIQNYYNKFINNWNEFIFQLKSHTNHPACPHQFSCIHYILKGGLKTFSVGYGVQLFFTFWINFKKIKRNPKIALTLPFRPNVFNLGIFFGGFTAIYRGIACLIRRKSGENIDFIPVPAGFFAGLMFYFYRDNTIALYVFWKTLQLSYNIGVEKGFVPEVPWASVFFHAFSTAILFHTALVEPKNLRPSYWKFLQAMSGGRIGDMDRKCMEPFGLHSHDQLNYVLSRTKH